MSPPSTAKSLLDMPSEIRQAIYQLAFEPKYEWIQPLHTQTADQWRALKALSPNPSGLQLCPPNLLFTCKQIYNEAIDIFIRVNSVRIYANGPGWPELCEEKIKAIVRRCRAISIRLDAHRAPFVTSDEPKWADWYDTLVSRSDLDVFEVWLVGVPNIDDVEYAAAGASGAYDPYDDAVLEEQLRPLTLIKPRKSAHVTYETSGGGDLQYGDEYDVRLHNRLEAKFREVEKQMMAR